MPIFQSAKKELSILFLDNTHKNVCVNLLKIPAIHIFAISCLRNFFEAFTNRESQL